MNETIIIALFALLAALIAILTGWLIALSRELHRAAPPWLTDALRHSADDITAALQHRARSTPNQLDDTLAAYIRQAIRDALDTTDQG